MKPDLNCVFDLFLYTTTQIHIFAACRIIPQHGQHFELEIFEEIHYYPTSFSKRCKKLPEKARTPQKNF
jgi:hypothetical protein